MSVLLTVLALLGLVAASGLLGRWLPRLPQPLLQLALGAACGWPTLGLQLRLEPAVFMLLFVPPLLFADGWLIPKRELRAGSWGVLALAVGLVLLTVALAGLAIQALLPGLPPAAAFLLAAVLSPTDAVAVSAITRGRRMPARLQHLLEGESLMNDATALVAVKVALAAVMTSVFSPRHAAAEMAVTALGGLCVGGLCALAFELLQRGLLLRCRERDMALPGVLLILLLPFPPYLLAEHWGLSGVLAVVAAGMGANLLAVRRSGFHPGHLQAAHAWEVVRHAFDGLVFLLLGMQLAHIVAALPGQLNVFSPQAGDAALRLWGAGLAIALTLAALRFLAVLGAVQLRRALNPRHRPSRTSPVLSAAIVALGGVRGAITLVAVLGLPLALPDGRPFPSRGVMVFEAGLVIVLSMAAAALLLPALLRRAATQASASGERALRHARGRSGRAALRALQTCEDASADARQHITWQYQQRLLHDGHDAAQREDARREQALLLRMLQAERDELRRLRLSHRINDETLRQLLRELDLREAALHHAQG